MGITGEINAMVKKAALGMPTFQAPTTTPGTKSFHMQHMQNAKNLRGIASGAKEVIPEFIDFAAGFPAGVINGTGQWLGGGSFRKGWHDSKDFVRNYYSDPARKFLGWAGTPIRKVTDSAINYHDNEIRKMLGPETMPDGTPSPAHDQYARDKADMDAMANTLGSVTRLALSLPLYGGMGKTLQVATKAGKWGKWVRPMYDKLGRQGKLGRWGKWIRAGAPYATSGTPYAADYMIAAGVRLGDEYDNMRSDVREYLENAEKRNDPWSIEALREAANNGDLTEEERARFKAIMQRPYASW